MNFAVKKVSESFVKPFESTPSGKLSLSWQDRLPTNRFLTDILFVYKNGSSETVQVIRDALSKALVPYYPIAGILSYSEHGELQVDCTGDGVWFVEAVADCTLVDVNYLDYPLKIPKEELFPQAPSDPMLVITMVQVTTFSCGGFAIGFRSSHVITDATGCMQFLMAVAEIARTGNQSPSIKPIWCRDPLPRPPKLPYGPLPPLPATVHEFAAVDVPFHRVNKLKSKLTEELGRRCSTFDVLAAIVWQSKARAIQLAPDADTHLIFPADARRFVKDVIDTERYYGNCVYMVRVRCPGEKIVKGSLADVVKVLKATKDNLRTEFSKWINGDITFDDPYKLFTSYGTLFVNDLSAIDSDDQDYGCGSPACVLPQLWGVNSCLLLKSPAAKQSARFLAQCVQQEHLQTFVQQLMESCNMMHLQTFFSSKISF